MRHAWLRHFHPFRDLETNAATQYRVHTLAQRFWILNVPVVLYLVIWQPQLWLVWGLLLTTLYSLYANWATDNGAAASARTVMQTTPTTKELSHDIQALRHTKWDKIG